MEISDDEGVSSRPMRLKVLYTFDAENKNNCLVRWPNTLDVRTAYLDNNTQIGIIDLKTCLQAITSSSPELISQLGNDYTIYAYDYSEPDVPLVGQGLLSWALASNTQETEAESDGNNFVTGLVTRNGLGLFSRNAQETLEVKLRLTPVPSSTQNDYLNSLLKYKQASDVIGQDFDAQAWTSFVQGNPAFVSSAGRAQSSDRSASPMDRAGVEAAQRMLSEGVTPRDMASGIADPFTTRSGSRPPSRSATPLGQPFNVAPRQQTAHMSRPSSRGGMQPVSHQRRESFNSGYYSAEETFEEGPSKKRAKIMKVDGLSKSNLNIERQPESLRVAASTASSVRLHRPIAVNPALALQNGPSAEEPIRPPTPIPKSANLTNRRQRNNSSSLRRASRVRSSSPAPQLVAQPLPSADTAMLSPEDTRPASISSSPANIPSSPPIMPLIGSLPTSPVLPPLPGGHDSGFMSGTFDDFFDDGNMVHFDDYVNDKEVENHGVGLDNNMTMSTHFTPVFEDGNDVDEAAPPSLPPSLLPTNESAPPKPAFSRAQTSRPASRVSMSSPKLAPAPVPRARQMEEEMRAFSQLPQVATSDPAGRGLHRSNTWAGDMSDMPTSDAVMAEDVKRRPKKRVGKEQTKARLETAIAAGEMPPFCDNCGAIETPAWRRAFAKTFDCDFDEVETSLEDGSIVFKEALDHNEDGSIKTFRGFKITKKPEDRDDEWQAITLCNPCGLWFHKQKCMRPPEKWNKGPKDPKEKRKRRARPRSERAAARKTSGGNNSRGDASTPASDASTPQDTATEAAGPEEGENDDREGRINGQNDGTDEPELPPMPKRATSAEPVAEGTRAAADLSADVSNQTGQRAIQSSPARHHGSEAEPIELDLTPKPLRRQLFSPQNPNSAKSAASASSSDSSKPLASLPNFVRRSPRFNKTKEVFGLEGHIDGTSNKENVTPGRGLDDGLNDLFDDGEGGVQLPPMTPTPTRRSDRLLFKTPSKTPSRTPGAALSPNVQASGQKSLRHPAAAALLGTMKKVEDMTPFSKQIHQILSDANPHNLRSSPPRPFAVPARRTPKKASPRSAADFDFPDLPSLNNSSPMSQNQQINFNFSELTTEQVQTDFQDVSSSDRPMPSSPPQGFFGFVDTHDDGMNGLWSEMDFGNGHAFLEEAQYPGSMASPKVTAVGAGPRRSPRNR